MKLETCILLVVNALKRLQSKFANTPFSPRDIKRLGITPAQLKPLLNEEQVLRLGRGIYVLPGTDLDDEALFRSASMRIDGPSAVCLISALAFYGITDELPKKIWLLVPENKHTAHKDIRLLRRNDPQWKVGIIANDGYKITSLERSIVDALALKRIVGVSVGVSALKAALTQKKTTLDKILKTATQLRVDHQIMSYIEALA
jgi:predicted transcriptional regulator of viral defense system